MIHVERKPLATADVKKIKDWLNGPGSLEFRRYLRAKQAEYAAEAGTLMVLGDEANDATDRVIRAQRLETVLEVLDQMRQSDYEFVIGQLQPKPLETDL